MKTISVAPVTDTLPEGDETVVLTLTAGAGYTLGTSTAYVTIHDSPFDNWRYQYFAADLSLSAFDLDPDRDGLKNFIEYAIGANPTASSPMDFVVGNSGFLSLTLTVSPVSDTLGEGAETVQATLDPRVHYIVGAPSSATLTIADNDPSAPGAHHEPSTAIPLRLKTSIPITPRPIGGGPAADKDRARSQNRAAWLLLCT